MSSGKAATLTDTTETRLSLADARLFKLLSALGIDGDEGDL